MQHEALDFLDIFIDILQMTLARKIKVNILEVPITFDMSGYPNTYYFTLSQSAHIAVQEPHKYGCKSPYTNCLEME